MTEKKIIETAKELIGKFIYDQIKDQGYTIEGIAEKANISKVTVYDIIGYRTNYTIDSFIAIIGALDLRIEIMNKLIEPEQYN